jgi:molybdate transport system regulatory protein
MTPDALNEALGHSISDKRLAVLRWVAQSGSISQAAREVGISYKAAWQAIDTLTSLSGSALVERTVGGAGGGGARITPEGLQLLALAGELASARQRVLAQFSGGAALAGGLGLRTSMRNQLPCTVLTLQACDEQDPMVVARLRGPGGSALEASLTRESADLLGLREGLVVLAMCKATAVSVSAWGPVREQQDLPKGTCVLRGQVQRISEGADRDEVSLALDGGGHWVGFAAHPWRAREGGAAVASMASSALVIGLSDGA